jgi:solute carrier family 35 protein E3
VLGSIAVLLLGIFLSTISDSQVSGNPLGIAVAVANVLVTALYQIWAGTKQKELGVSANQLLHQVAPVAVALLGVLVPMIEPLGLGAGGAAPGTILGYNLTPAALAWILLSSALGLVVTLSTFLFIGATSSLTYNVVGHLKTVAIVAAGVFLFGDEMSGRKLLGLGCAMAGIVGYTHFKFAEAAQQQHGAKASAR